MSKEQVSRKITDDEIYAFLRKHQHLKGMACDVILGAFRDWLEAQQQEEKQEPETCVWKQVDNYTCDYWPQCDNSPDYADKSVAQNYCAWCGKPIELQQSHPPIPETHRKPTKWERKNCLPPEGSLALTVSSPHQWEPWVLSEWEEDESVKQIIVPVDWNPEKSDDFKIKEAREVVGD